MWNVANSFVTQWHYLVTLMKRNNVRILPPLLIITIKLSKKKCRISYEIDHNLQYAVFVSGIIQTTPVFATSNINLPQSLEPLESQVAKQIAFILHFEKLPSSFPTFTNKADQLHLRFFFTFPPIRINTCHPIRSLKLLAFSNLCLDCAPFKMLQEIL